MMKSPFIILLLSLLYFSATAQTDLQTTCATSGEGTANHFTITYSIGEMTLVNTSQYNNFILTQGILQPDKMSIDPTSGNFYDGEIQVFPTPTSGLLTIRVGALTAGTFITQLFDLSGKLLKQDQFSYDYFNLLHEIDLSRYSNAMYLLKIVFTPSSASNHTKHGTYKVIKIN